VVPMPTGWALRLLKCVNAVPMPRPIRQLARDWMYRRHWPADMENLCPHCGKIAWLDCRTIPYPTCGRDECEDGILMESWKCQAERRERQASENQGSSVPAREARQWPDGCPVEEETDDVPF